MSTRFKLIAAALGLVVSAGAIGDASAKTVTVTRTVGAGIHRGATTRIVAHRPHRIHFGTRIVKHVRIVHRAPARVATLIGRPAAGRTFTKTIVHVAKRPLLQRHAMLHRAGTRTTIVR